MQTSERISVVALVISFVAISGVVYTFVANPSRPYYIYLAILMLATSAGFIIGAVLETVYGEEDGTYRSIAFWVLALVWLASAMITFAHAACLGQTPYI